MKQKTRSICNYFKEKGCRESCPLSKPCKFQVGDNMQKLADRMNAAAVNVEFKGFQ